MFLFWVPFFPPKSSVKKLFIELSNKSRCCGSIARAWQNRPRCRWSANAAGEAMSIPSYLTVPTSLTKGIPLASFQPSLDLKCLNFDCRRYQLSMHVLVNGLCFWTCTMVTWGANVILCNVQKVLSPQNTLLNMFGPNLRCQTCTQTVETSIHACISHPSRNIIHDTSLWWWDAKEFGIEIFDTFDEGAMARIPQQCFG